MYGGGHYIASAAAHVTPQGHAIFEASSKFGDGKTLPVSRRERPCHRGGKFAPLKLAVDDLRETQFDNLSFFFFQVPSV